MKYRMKPVVIDAVQFTDPVYGYRHVAEFVGYDISDGVGSSTFAINTFGGTMTANLGDWVIRGIQGDFYLCKPDIFAATYEPVSD